jgi:ABC-type phosphate/phosphonate transport system substrate-binding protein
MVTVHISALIAISACVGAMAAAETPSTLKIGATGTLTGMPDDPKEKAGLDLLQRFIKEETGMNNEITGQMSYEELATAMAKGQMHVGVFQGYELAWLHDKYPELKPLALGVNGTRYSSACIVTSRKKPVMEFADLQGKSLATPVGCHTFLRLYLDRQCESLGKKAESFFSTLAPPTNVEDCLDDVIDGKFDAAIIDQAGLDGFKRRKPGRFNQLKEVARSQPFPPVVVAYYGNVLNSTTVQQFKASLLGAARKEKGELLLSLSRLTAFEAVPDDFPKALAATLKAYPSGEIKPK